MNASVETARKIGPVYLFWNGETTLDSPVKAAWPHVLNYPSWQNYSTVQTISGKPGQEGEVVVLRKDEMGIQFPPYCARTILLQPEHRVVWKTWPQQRSEELDFFGIVEFRLYAADSDKTRFVYNTVYEFMVPYRQESELQTFREQQYQNFELLFSSILPKLKALTGSKL